VSPQLEPINRVGEEPTTAAVMAQRLKVVAIARAEETLAELPKLARRFATLLLVLPIAIPVVVVLLVVLLWQLAP
jgi:hypothetical protein